MSTPETPRRYIESIYFPGFVMEVLESRPCETPDHEAFRVIDPEGQEDWLCARDVKEVER